MRPSIVRFLSGAAAADANRPVLAESVLLCGDPHIRAQCSSRAAHPDMSPSVFKVIVA